MRTTYTGTVLACEAVDSHWRLTVAVSTARVSDRPELWDPVPMIADIAWDVPQAVPVGRGVEVLCDNTGTVLRVNTLPG